MRASSSFFLLMASFLPEMRESPALAATPRDTLVVAFESKPRSADPRLIGTDANSQYLEELRFLPLFSADEEGLLKAVLAESATAQGPLVWRVKLRKGIRSVAGGEITAEDVAATYRAITQTSKDAPPSPRKGAFDKLSSVNVVNTHEVEFVLREPDAPFLGNLVVGILPREALSHPPEQLQGKGFETGPYVLEKADDEEWVFTRNAIYSGAPHGGEILKLPRVVFRIIGDSGTRYAALVKGDVDLVQNSLDADKVAELQKSHAGEISLATRTGLNTTYLAFHMKRAPFDNPLVRKAIAKGINVDEILRFSLQGLGTRATGMFPSGLPWHESSLAPQAYEPDAAKKLLDEAGLRDPDGRGPKTRATLHMKVPTQRERIAIAKAIAGQLKRVGLDVRIETLEGGLFNRQLNSGQVDMWIAPWTGFKDPDHLHYVFHSTQIPPVGGNRGHYGRANVDKLLADAKVEGELTKRVALYSQAQKILAQDLPYVYLWHKLNFVAMRSRVQGFRLYADGRYKALTVTEKTK